jgi:hypothetical protein
MGGAGEADTRGEAVNDASTYCLPFILFRSRFPKQFPVTNKIIDMHIVCYTILRYLQLPTWKVYSPALHLFHKLYVVGFSIIMCLISIH